MLLAGSYQIKTLLHQIKLLKSAVKATESTTKLESLPSINSSLLSNFDRRRALIRMMRTVLIITVTITLSMVLYCFVCISKKLNAPRSAIFHIYESAMGHLYVILYVSKYCQSYRCADLSRLDRFIYSTLDAIIVGLILFQSFDASTTREKAALSYADSATSSDSTKSSSSFGSMEKRLSLLAPTSSAIILSKTDVKNIVIEDPMVLPPIYSPRNSVIRVGKRESISSIRSISRVSVPVWEGDLAKSAVVE